LNGKQRCNSDEKNLKSKIPNHKQKDKSKKGKSRTGFAVLWFGACAFVWDLRFGIWDLKWEK